MTRNEKRSKTIKQNKPSKLADIEKSPGSPTKPRLAQERFDQSEEDYRILFETMAQGVVYQNADGNITSANPAARRILGPDLDQLIGKTSIDPRQKVIHEDGSDFPDDTHPSMIALNTGKESKDVMGIYNPKEDKYTWIDVHAVPHYRPGEDKPYMVFTTIDDISEHKKSQDALTESKEFLRYILNINSSIIYRCRTSGSYEATYVSENIKRLTGYEPQEFIETELWEKNIHPEDSSRVLNGLSEIFKQGSYSYEYRWKIKNGTYRWMHDELSLVRDLNGNPLEIIGVWLDITKQKKAEKELLQSHKLLDALKDVQNNFIVDSEQQILFDDLLKIFISLTQSEYGFIGEILYDPGGNPYLKTFAITNISWDKDTKEFYEKNAPLGMEFKNLKTLFGKVMITGKRVVYNNPSVDASKSGLPEGHPPLNSFLGLPFYQANKLVGMAGIANRPGGYNQDIIDYLQPLLITCANIMEAYKGKQLRKQIEGELIKRNIQQKAILNNIPDIAWLKDSESRFIAVNEPFALACGLSSEELIGRTDLDIWPHDLAERYRADDRDVIIKGRRKQVEEPLVNDKGMESWIETIKTPIYDDHGEIIGTTGIAHDITERKRAEEKIRIAERKYRTIFEQSPFPIFMIDPETSFPLEFNDSIIKLLGYSREEFSKLKIEDYEVNEDPEMIKDHLKNILSEGHALFETKIRSKDGEIKDVLVNTRVIEISGKRIFHTILIDMTEQKRTEEIIKESEEKYRTIIENSNDMIFTMNSEGKILYLNKYAEEITGYTLEELQDENIATLIHEDESSLITEILHKILDGIPQQYEVSVKCRDGSIIILSVNSAPIYSKGLIVGNVNFARNITELKKIEKILLENERLDELNKARSEFLNIMSHELRTPLTSIIAFSILLKERLHGKLNKKQEAYIETIHKSGLHLLDLINNMLDIAKMEAGKMEVVIETFSVPDLIRGIIELVKEESRKKNIVFETNIDPSLDTMKADLHKMKQIIFNLLNNAMKFMKEGGALLPYPQERSVKWYEFQYLIQV